MERKVQEYCSKGILRKRAAPHFSNAKLVDIVLVGHEERRFFRLTTPWEEVVRTLVQIPEKGSIRGIARSSGHDKSTICNGLIWLMG